MAYSFQKATLYKRELYHFQNGSQDVNVAFEPIGNKEYLMIIFADDGKQISNYHHQDLRDTLNEILVAFDDNNNYDYQVAAV